VLPTPVLALHDPLINGRICAASCVTVFDACVVASHTKSRRVYRRCSCPAPLRAGLWPRRTLSPAMLPPFILTVQVVAALSHLFILHCLLMYHVRVSSMLAPSRLIPAQRLSTYDWIIRREQDSNFSLFRLRQPTALQLTASALAKVVSEMPSQSGSSSAREAVGQVRLMRYALMQRCCAKSQIDWTLSLCAMCLFCITRIEQPRLPELADATRARTADSSRSHTDQALPGQTVFT
jgi:hypothetical protein